eukprot:2206309-Pyramimonas_sp.AAC.1
MYDKPPDPSIFRIGCAQATSDIEVQSSIKQWITDAGVNANQCTVYGQSPGKVLFIHLPGGAPGFARAVQLAQHLLLPGGTWRRSSALAVSGATGALCINPGKSPKQVRNEMQ